MASDRENREPAFNHRLRAFAAAVCGETAPLPSPAGSTPARITA
ncbi:hypothetical protein FHR22_002467 [Sphingopyxis panaciterrae]|nr:hypothetical protein [Sphingopyxis panaciterrae]